MIDIQREQLIHPTEACKHPLLRRPNGRAAHVCTIYRYFRGRRASDGRFLRLESVVTPRGRVTSVEAIQRFVQDLNPGPPAVTPLPPALPPPSPANDFLDALGVK